MRTTSSFKNADEGERSNGQTNVQAQFGTTNRRTTSIRKRRIISLKICRMQREESVSPPINGNGASHDEDQFEKAQGNVPAQGDVPAQRSSSIENPSLQIPPPSNKDDGTNCKLAATPIFQFLVGMKEDLLARLPLYGDDWARPKSIFKVLNASMFAFVVQLVPALIFGNLLDRQTDGNLAIPEVLLSAGIIGIIYAVFSGQPLVLLGITGPVAILLGTSYSLAATFEAEYFAFFWWVCIWTAILHWITALLGLVNFVWHITPFTSQVFEFFTALNFTYESMRDLIRPIYLMEKDLTAEERSVGYASLVIGIVTFLICWTLHFAETWVYWTPTIRTFLKSYNMMIALVIMTALSFLPGVTLDNYAHRNPYGGGAIHYGIERIRFQEIPWNWQPSATDPPRSWIADPFNGIDAVGVFGALFPAVMVYLLFFIDHNISSILTQSSQYNLRKPPAYHWDFFVLGLTIVPCGVLGIPPGSGLLPQAPLHTRALCTRKYVERLGVKHEIVEYCEEQRWSGLFQACLMLVTLFCLKVISWIPVGCLLGIFLYFGVDAMYGNGIWERITLCFILPKNRPKIPLVENVPWRTVQIFTLLQAAAAVLTFGVAQFASIGA